MRSQILLLCILAITVCRRVRKRNRDSILMHVQPDVTIRTARAEDSAACGEICYAAFSAISAAHGFPCDFSAPEATTRLHRMLFSNPDFYCVVAEADGRILGSNVLDERSPIRGVGPITVDPVAQNLGVGRKLMGAAIERAQQRGAAGMRLVQAAYNRRSFSLYASLGFDVREPLSCMQGRTSERSMPGCVVRAAKDADLDACNALSRRVHGFERGAELTQAIQQGTAQVVERGKRITGYTTHMAFFGHSTGETNLDVQALISSTESFAGSGILVPSRNSRLFRWCLENGLRVVQPLTLMSNGLYNEPSGAWLPSIFF
jgi:predicted N-acetyltransferase YhbS